MSENNSNNPYLQQICQITNKPFIENIFLAFEAKKLNEKQNQIHREENDRLDVDIIFSSHNHISNNFEQFKLDTPNDRITQKDFDLNKNKFEVSKEEMIETIIEEAERREEVLKKSNELNVVLDNEQADKETGTTFEQLIKLENQVKIEEIINEDKSIKPKETFRNHAGRRHNMTFLRQTSMQKSKKIDFQRKKSSFASNLIAPYAKKKNNIEPCKDNKTQVENLDVIINHFSKKQNNPKKNSIRSYNDLAFTLEYLNKFDWLEENSPNSKFLPGRFLSPIIIWFIICNGYFPRMPYINYTIDQILDAKKEKIKALSFPIDQRITKLMLKNEIIPKAEQLNEEDTDIVNFLSSCLRNPNISNTKERSQSKVDSTIIQEKKIHKTNNITNTNALSYSNIKPNYTHEDDQWLLSNKINLYNFFKKKCENDNNKNKNGISDEQLMKLISKIDLQDIINYYEIELENISIEYENNIEKLRDIINKEISQEQILLKNNLIQTNDILIDLTVKLPEEDLFLNLLEKKQSELKEHNKSSYIGKENNNQQHHFSELKTKPKVQIEDMVCQICNDGDYAEEDLIVFCAKCNISVHQRCYGIPKIPNDDWICELCKSFGESGKYLRCPLCSKRGGAMKPTQLKADTIYFSCLNSSYHEFLQGYCQTRDLSKSLTKKPRSEEIQDETNESNLIKEEYPEINHNSYEIKKELLKDPERHKEYEDNLYYDYHVLSEFSEKELLNEPKPDDVWVHMTCVMFLPELFFGDKYYMTNIEGFNCLNKDRFKIECIVCQKKNGAIVNCDKGQCKKAFHPECARRAKYFLDIRQSETSQQLGYFIFCEKHTPLKLRRILESKEKKYRDELARFCKSIEKYYFTYANENKSFVGGGAIECISDDMRKSIIKRKKYLIQKNDAQYFLPLVENYKKKIPSSFSTITLQKLPKSDGYSTQAYKLIDVYVAPKNCYLSARKLTQYDEIWKYIPYKNFSPEQKYKRYKKLLKLYNKKTNEVGRRGRMKNKYIKKTLKIARSERQKYHEKKSKKKIRNKIINSSVYTEPIKIEEEDNSLYCLCRKPYRDGELMICCDNCENWYHPKCVGFNHTKEEAENMTWFCPNCEKNEKKRKNPVKFSSEESKIQKKVKRLPKADILPISLPLSTNLIQNGNPKDIIINTKSPTNGELLIEQPKNELHEINISACGQVYMESEMISNVLNENEKDDGVVISRINKAKSKRGRRKRGGRNKRL